MSIRATAQVRVVSDPIPTIVKGVPTRLQRLDVNVDKPGFMVNPTRCEPKEVKATLRSAAGQTAALNARFQVGACGDLGFSPKLALGLTGRKQITTGKHPGIRANVPPGRRPGRDREGKGRRCPPRLALDPDNAQALCEFTDGTKPDLENHCPKGSIVGRAKASTPLLERDLTGNVYFVKNVRTRRQDGQRDPDAADDHRRARGEIAINLKGEASTTKAGTLVNTFANVPDAPISAVQPQHQGRQQRNPRRHQDPQGQDQPLRQAQQPPRRGRLDGHNGKTADYTTKVKTPCGKTKTARRPRRR